MSGWKPRPQLLGGLLSAAFVLCEIPVANAEEAARQVCLEEAVRGQQLLRSRRLRDAIGPLTRCARDVCPGVVRRDCAMWLEEAETALPTIVLAVRDPTGRDVVDGRATVDGVPVADALSGRALPLDPGPHAVRVETATGLAVERTIVARENQKGREVVLDLAEVAPPPSRRTGQRRAAVPTLTYVSGGIAIAAGATSAIFGAQALSERASQCDADHRCARPVYEDIQAGYTVATLVAGVAALALAAAIWSYLR
jgi:hypothetical protein